MKLNALLISTIVLAAYDNDLDAYVPELWAQESLMILEANMVLGNMVHRDFENVIAQYGDTVNTRRPSKFTMSRKADTDSVTVQDALATNVAVKLDQHLHTSFLIKDGQEAKGFKNLIQEFLSPAVLSLAQGIDEIVGGQVYQFLPNSVGAIGTSFTSSTLVDARDKMNSLLVPSQGRNIVLTSSQEAALLKDNLFTAAQNVGDQGGALREGALGRKFGFDIYMDQNIPSIAAGNTTVTGAVNNAGGYSIGATAITVNGFSAAITAGAWCTIAGRPYRILSTVGGATPTQLNLDAGGLIAAVSNSAVIVVYTPGAVNNVSGYYGASAANLTTPAWAKAITVNGFSVAPKTGQLITFGAASAASRYSALTAPTTTSLLLDRPLDASIANSDAVGIGPAGQYGFAFHRNAIALVTRPLATPMAGTGARSFVASYNGLSLRVTITYDGNKQGHLVTIDVLAGIKVLDTNLGVPVLA